MKCIEETDSVINR